LISGQTASDDIDLHTSWATYTVSILRRIEKPYRTWAAAHLYLMAAAVKNLKNKELVWEKQEK